MIQNLIFVILFLKILFRASTLVPTFQWTSSEFFLFQILWQKISKPIKTSEKEYSTIQFRLKNLITRISTLLKLKLICSQSTGKKLCHFANFPANMFLFGVRKNICTALFPDAQELLYWSTLKANFCIFLYISLRKFLFQRRSKILSGGGW